MKYLLIITMFVTFMLPRTLRAAEIIDRVIAQVNDDIITLSELNDKGRPYFHEIMSRTRQGDIELRMQKARLEVLDKLIEGLLLKQEAEKYGIKIDPAEIDQAIGSIISKNHITEEKFLKELKRVGTTMEEYRAGLEDQIRHSRLLNTVVRSKIVITDEQIESYYNTYYNQKAEVPEGYHILQIGLQWGPDKPLKSQEDAEKAAGQIISELEAGNDFATVARRYSQLPSAEDGGDIGAFKEEEMAPYMLQAVQALHPGEFSPVIRTPNGLQILKLLSVRKNGVTQKPPLESVRRDIEETLYKQEMKSAYDKWLKRLRAKAYIKKNL